MPAQNSSPQGRFFPPKKKAFSLETETGSTILKRLPCVSVVNFSVSVGGSFDIMRRATPTVTPTSTKKRTIGRSSLIESKTNIRSTLKAATVPPGTSASGSGSLPPSTPVPTITHSSSSLSNNLDIEIFNLGEKIYLHGLKKWGVVRYFGDALFSDGKWVGVELFEELGRNDGTVQGHRYFSCKPKYGVFVRPANCSRATNIPASKPIAATPNVRTTSRLTTRASLPNTTVSRSSTMEMKMTSGSEYDSVATRQPTDYKRSSSDLPSDDVLSDEFLTRIASRLLADEKFRSKLIPTSSSPANERYDSLFVHTSILTLISAIDVSSRITRLENSLVPTLFDFP